MTFVTLDAVTFPYAPVNMPFEILRKKKATK